MTIGRFQQWFGALPHFWDAGLLAVSGPWLVTVCPMIIDVYLIRLLTSLLLTFYMLHHGWLHAIHPKFSQVLELAFALVAEVSKCSTASAQTASRNCRGWMVHGAPWWSCVCQGDGVRVNTKIAGSRCSSCQRKMIH